MIPDRLATTNPDLRLRAFTTGDAGAVFDYWRSDAGWERFNASVPRDFTLADAKAFVEEMCGRSRAASPNWAILYDERVVGVVSLVFEQGHRLAAVGYGVHGGIRGAGLAPTSVSSVLNSAFDCYPELRKIRAHTDPRNTASHRVLEKLGFALEGVLRKNQYVKGEFVDEAIYGLLREDWSSLEDR